MCIHIHINISTYICIRIYLFICLEWMSISNSMCSRSLWVTSRVPSVHLLEIAHYLCGGPEALSAHSDIKLNGTLWTFMSIHTRVIHKSVYWQMRPHTIYSVHILIVILSMTLITITLYRSIFVDHKNLVVKTCHSYSGLAPCVLVKFVPLQTFYLEICPPAWRWPQVLHVYKWLHRA